MEVEEQIIEMEHLIINLLFEYQKRKIKDFITYREILLYAGILKNEFSKKNINLTFYYDKLYNEIFLKRNSDYFKESDDKTKIMLEKNVDMQELVKKSRQYLSDETIALMTDNNIINDTTKLYTDDEVLKLYIGDVSRETLNKRK